MTQEKWWRRYGAGGRETVPNVCHRKEGYMILVVDVGNTNMTMGVYEGSKLKATFHIMTKVPRTSDEYGVLITQLLQNRGVRMSALEGSIVSSVVPDVMHSFLGALVRYTQTKPLNVGPGMKTGIRIVTEDPRAIGADRIVDAVAAYTKYGGPVLVLDFGTATTYDLITEKGEFTAGITAPGIRPKRAAAIDWETKRRMGDCTCRREMIWLIYRIRYSVFAAEDARAPGRQPHFSAASKGERYFIFALHSSYGPEIS